MKKYSRFISKLILVEAILITSFTSSAIAALVDAPWTGSGSGSTNVVSDGITPPAVFQYSDNYYVDVYNGYSGSWHFDAVASSTRMVVLKYNYTGFHAYSTVTVVLTAFEGVTEYPLVNTGTANCCTPPSGGFTYAGTVALPVQAGDTYGFKMSGSNQDIIQMLSGQLTVDELNKDDCIEGAWQIIKDTNGALLFKTQDDCVSFVETEG